jgi:hypothetical protein
LIELRDTSTALCDVLNTHRNNHKGWERAIPNPELQYRLKFSKSRKNTGSLIRHYTNILIIDYLCPIAHAYSNGIFYTENPKELTPCIEYDTKAIATHMEKLEGQRLSINNVGKNVLELPPITDPNLIKVLNHLYEYHKGVRNAINTRDLQIELGIPGAVDWVQGHVIQKIVHKLSVLGYPIAHASNKGIFYADTLDEMQRTIAYTEKRIQSHIARRDARIKIRSSMKGYVAPRLIGKQRGLFH